MITLGILDPSTTKHPNPNKKRDFHQKRKLQGTNIFDNQNTICTLNKTPGNSPHHTEEIYFSINSLKDLLEQEENHCLALSKQDPRDEKIFADERPLSSFRQSHVHF